MLTYFAEQGTTYEECLRKARAKYGDNIQIYMQRTVQIGGFLGLFSREGVEIMGFVKEPERPQSLLSSLSRKDVASCRDAASSPVKGEGSRTLAAATPRSVETSLEEEKQKILALAGKGSDPTIKVVLQEVRSLKERLESQLTVPSAVEEHPTIVKIGELLAGNEFSHSYISRIQQRIRREFPLAELEDFDRVQKQVVEWIGESIELYSGSEVKTKPRVMVLVGPTGVGKTTTIAKLAAIYGLGINNTPAVSVRMITIDNYRIAARQQIEKYGEIMGIPVSCVETYEDLRKTISLYADEVDLVLVDTIGKSPRDSIKLAEMKELLAACGTSMEVHLALAATTKASDIKEILQQFEPFNYRSVIVTKLDETNRIGNVVSALHEKGKSISFITNGQRVPQDIERASVVNFLINLEGFKIDRPYIEKRFSKTASDVLEGR